MSGMSTAKKSKFAKHITTIASNALLSGMATANCRLQPTIGRHCIWCHTNPIQQTINHIRNTESKLT